jgi:hypothetical protein
MHKQSVKRPCKATQHAILATTSTSRHLPKILFVLGVAKKKKKKNYLHNTAPLKKETYINSHQLLPIHDEGFRHLETNKQTNKQTKKGGPTVQYSSINSSFGLSSKCCMCHKNKQSTAVNTKTSKTIMYC